MSASEASAAPAATMGSSAGQYDLAPMQNSPTQQTHPLPQSPPAGQTFQQQQQQRSVKRPRPVKSCTECRKRKLRCDRLCPCSQCQKSGRACRYAADYDSANLSDGSDGETESGRPAKRLYMGSSGPTILNSGESAPLSGLSADQAASTGMSFVEELGVRMDRLEKHMMSKDPTGMPLGGDTVIPGPAPTLRGLSVKRGGQRTRFFGQSSPRVLVNLFEDAKDFLRAGYRSNGLEGTFQQFRQLHRYLREEYQKSLAPITVFVDSVMPIRKRMTDILPKKPVCDRLITAYIDHSEAICRILHFPTFTEQYDLFWEGKLQCDYFLPQLLAVLSIASRFTTKSQGFGHERVEGVHLPTAFALVRTWLDGLRGKELTELGILQVEMLLIVCQKTLMFRPQELWTQLGSVVRMAMTMALHRDPSEFEPRISPFMGEMRRRLWFSVLDMDVQTSVDCTMPCFVREGDFSCRPPRNLDDRELYHDMQELPPGKPLEQFTETQAQVLGACSLATRAKISHLINRIDNVRDYQEVLDVGGKLEDFLEDMSHIMPRHGIADHSRKSRIWRERVTFDAHIRRPLLALYRPFALNSQTCPPQISKSFMRSCMITLNYSDELDPMLPHYHEVMGILHQFFKTDILPAAFSVCYFIRACVQPHANGLSYDGQRALRVSTDSPNRSPSLQSDSLLLWSPERLIHTVERTLGHFVQNVHRNIGTKDVIALCVILEMVRTPEPRGENIAHALHSALERCMKAANLSPEKLAMATPTQAQSSTPGFAPEPYSGGQSRGYMYNDPMMGQHNSMGSMGGWIIWEGWD